MGRTDNHIFDWEAGDKAATDDVFASADVVSSCEMLDPRAGPGADGDLRCDRLQGRRHQQDHHRDHLNWGASYLVNDVYLRFIKPDASRRAQVIASRLATVVLMLLSLVVMAFLTSVEQGWKT